MQVEQRMPVPVQAADTLIRAYQLVISPWLPAACRFQPTCSEYAREAIRRRGLVRGFALAVARLARCQPFAKSGFDPVD